MYRQCEFTLTKTQESVKTLMGAYKLEEVQGNG
jgi:hypothetical protein